MARVVSKRKDELITSHGPEQETFSVCQFCHPLPGNMVFMRLLKIGAPSNPMEVWGPVWRL